MRILGRKQLPHTTIGSFVFALLLLGSALVALSLEAAPFLSRPIAPAQRFEMLHDLARPSGLSINAHTIVLGDCLEAIAGPYGRVQPPVQRDAMLTTCANRAKAAVTAMPTFALGWTVAAYTSAEQGNYDAFNFQLTTARKTAPNERWQAELRVHLAHSNNTHLTPQNLRGEQQDLILLIRSTKGLSSLISRYISQPETRPRIAGLLQTLEPALQTKFLNYLRAAAQPAAQDADDQ